MKERWLGASGLVLNEPLIFEKGARGRKGYSLPRLDVEEVKPDKVWPQKFIRRDLEGFPEMSELDVVRHFTRLSQWNYGVDSGFYPLGSCTMKYNPKVNELICRDAGFAHLHPLLPQLSGGGMLTTGGRRYMLIAPWLVVWPGLALTVVIFGVNMLGDAMRDILDPRMTGGAGRYGTRSKKQTR